MTARSIPRAARSARAWPTRSAVSPKTTSPSCVLCTSGRFTHTGNAPTPWPSTVDTKWLGTNGTFASWNCVIIRSRYVLRTARGLLTWGTPRASTACRRWRMAMRSHIMNTPTGRGSGELRASSGLFSVTWNPRASSSLPVRAGGHLRSRRSSQVRNAPDAVDAHPDRLLVGDERRDGEHARVGGPPARGVHEPREVRRSAPGIDGRDQRASPPEPPIDLEETLEGRRGRLHDELDVDAGEARAHALDTRASGVVDDDHERGHAGRQEIRDRRLDQRHPGDRDQRLGHGEAARPEPAALAGGDDPGWKRRRHRRHSSSSPSDRTTRSPGQHGVGRAAGGTSQMCRMPTPRAPAMSRVGESPTNVASPAATPTPSSARWKMRGSGLVQPTRAESTITAKSPCRPTSAQTVSRLP